ncbi:MAG: tRNA pseudouridine(55) synthase TruB [Thermosynechococcus sp. Uc]|uniref:tRNA pseudouridine(55) synthase TruB n=1 Tax=Thermosynechococcus sp. Uc TaxID=3034853 RepID=UPI0019E5BFC8|nr:tRNA pseudouridine(55) synthase TruB [Thermosynechococcus sp. Uc]MDM7327081.1 tRNA pseudouridine(55) synthase TruB [Thermosynechococcus sp. Uc]HIK26376.1 tRNA pseudouridine(55) synthase TruB [Thermosynechococcus sp. M46_R2017_013]
MFGFLNLNKPAGYTSHDCINELRKRLRLKRIGHGGTLDPMATGVLPIALGSATRLLPYLCNRKVYIGTVRFGITTTTDDITGNICQERAADHLTLAAIQEHLPRFIGQIEQLPPAYSAIQVGGQRLYARARAGEVVSAPPRTVEIYAIEVLDWQAGSYPELSLRISCGSGTYIRALARDLGAALGVGGTLATLQRIESGGLRIEQSHSLEMISPEHLPLHPPQEVLAHLPWQELDEAQLQDWYQGRAVVCAGLPSAQKVVGVTFAGTAVGIALRGGDRLHPKVVLKN